MKKIMMAILPHENFTIETNLSPDQIKQKLFSVIEIRKPWRFTFSITKPFVGNIRDDSFELAGPPGYYHYIGKGKLKGSTVELNFRMRE